MSDIEVNMTEALDAACRAFAKDVGNDWDKVSASTKHSVRELLLGPIEAALPFIIDQVLSGVETQIKESTPVDDGAPSPKEN